MTAAEKIEFSTADGFKIVGELYSPERPNGRAIVLLPMLNHDKRSWKPFAEQLQARGLTALALDLRGHGESLEQNGERRTWQQFSEKDFQNIVLDVEAASNYLKKRFPNHLEPFVAGASIGANTALNYAAKNSKKTAGAVLLSPGLNYRGVSTEQTVLQYPGALFIAASSEDAYSFESSQKLFDESTSANKFFEKLENAGHGTTMLLARPALAEKILEWLSANAFLVSE